jgi:hypothetical protein
MRSSVTMQTEAPMVFGLKLAKVNPTRAVAMVKGDRTSSHGQVERWGTHANRKDMASWQRLTGISYSKRKEVNWYISCQRTKHQESEDQRERQTTCKELLAESGDTNNGRKSESSTVGEDATLSDFQLKQC